jgi:hypothetical protein
MTGIIIAFSAAISAKYGFIGGIAYTLGYKMIAGTLPPLFLPHFVYGIIAGACGLGALFTYLIPIKDRHFLLTMYIAGVASITSFVLSFQALTRFLYVARWLLQ